MLVKACVQSIRFLDQSHSRGLVVLQEDDGDRVLPICIGPSEATAIAIELYQGKFPRPLTHDLLASVLGGLGGVLQKVVINRVEEDTYFAELIIQRDEDIISIDARPSDSIALALRTQAEIYVDDELIGLMSMETSEGAPFVTPGQMESRVESAEELAADDLKEYLRKLAPEDFGRFSP